MDMMIPYLPIILGLLGCIVGSFLNVVALRQETGKDLGGRSHCPHCNHQLSWYELIPVVSFLIQGGKCRNCRKKISLRYIGIELFTGILFFLTTLFFIKTYSSLSIIAPIWFFVPLVLLLITISYVALMVVYDIQTQTVPLVWFIGLVFFSSIYLISLYISGAASSVPSWLTIWFHGSGIGVALPFLALWLISQGKWIGFADIEIMAWMGMFFGVHQGISAVVTSFYLGSIFGIFFILYKLIKRIPYSHIRRTAIPFVPFLFLGWFVTLVYQFDIINLLSRLFM